MVIAIDGPAGVGKSTIASIFSRKIKFILFKFRFFL